MKDLPGRIGVRLLAAAVAILVALLAVASLPWRPERPAAPPRVVAAAQGSGPLSAGAAEVPFALPSGTPIAGFARLSFASDGVRAPVGARALVLSSPGCKVAIVSAELLLIPEALDAAVRARVSDLGLSGIVLTATHTHSGPGGFWRHALGERIGAGPYDARVEEAIVAGIADAIRRAAGALVPARASVGTGTADDLARSRSGGTEDAPLTVVRLEGLDGAAIAELTVFAAHATILGKANRSISGDWPGRFLARGAHGLRLFVQGAIGDQSVDGPDSRSIDGFAASLSRRVDALSFGAPERSPPFAFAAAEVLLPAIDVAVIPAPLRRAVRTLAYDMMPATARVLTVRLGPALIVAVPAEPVARVGVEWRAALPPGAVIASLAGGYIGYVEAADRMADDDGEPLTYYGPELAARLGAAVRAAASAADRAAPEARAAPGP